MALKSTIHKASLVISDIDHAYYASHETTLARHPSETDERMMIRLVAFALEAWQLQALCQGDGHYQFGRGLSDPDEPDLWLRDFTGACKVWAEVGQPDERALAKACGKADAVCVYAYHHAADVWWRGLEASLARYKKLKVLRIASEQSLEAAKLAERNMALHATIQEGILLLSSAKHSVHIEAKPF
jgi:uncharacterized protein YaeQ